MKILLTTFILLAAAPSLAAQNDGPRGERLQRQKSQQERVAPKQERHRDRSGERAERRQRILERFDANGDGRLDETERAALRAAAEKMRAQRGEKQGRRDGQVRERREGAERKERGKAGERAERRQRILERFDIDGDGQLNDLEREALRKAIEERRAERGVEGQQRRVRGQGQRERGEGQLRPQR